VYTLPPVKGSNLTALEPPTWGLHAKWSPLIPEPSRVADAMADIRIGTSAFIWVKVGPVHSIRGECSRAIPCLTMRLNLRRDNQWRSIISSQRLLLLSYNFQKKFFPSVVNHECLVKVETLIRTAREWGGRELHPRGLRDAVACKGSG